MTVFISIMKLIAGFFFVGLVMGSVIPVLILLLPWHTTRIRVTNYMGSLLGSVVVQRIAGCPVSVSGREFADGPALFVGNHTSTLDAFTSIWLSPSGTVGVAKRQILYYPFYGLVWLLSGHLTVDRGNNARAVRSMRKMGDFVKKERLSIFLWPEGTRSKDGRLLPFKKGMVHLALQTGLPIVPMVTVGAQNTWQRAKLEVRAAPLKIHFLPPIDTQDWTVERMEEQIKQVREAFLAQLPPEQQPA